MGIQACPCENREPEENWIPASAGITKWEKLIASDVQEISKKFLKRFY